MNNEMEQGCSGLLTAKCSAKRASQAWFAEARVHAQSRVTRGMQRMPREWGGCVSLLR